MADPENHAAQAGAPQPKRIVIHGDSLEWLKRPTLDITQCSVITSLPDVSEFGNNMSLDSWKQWFIDAARLVLASTPSQGAALFFQTDIKPEGQWVDKAYLVQKAAELEGCALLWHKLICKIKPGHASYTRPGYSHMLAFSKTLRTDIQLSTPDIIPESGDTTWAKGMGVEACREACRFILRETKTRTVLDPFCGHGTVLAVANAMGLDALGVELGGNRADKARRIQLATDGRLEFTNQKESPKV